MLTFRRRDGRFDSRNGRFASDGRLVSHKYWKKLETAVWRTKRPFRPDGRLVTTGRRMYVCTYERTITVLFRTFESCSSPTTGTLEMAMAGTATGSQETEEKD